MWAAFMSVRRRELRSATKSLALALPTSIRLTIRSRSATAFSCVLPGLKGILEGCSSGLLRKLWKGLHLHEELAARLQQAIVDEPPFSVREGGMIRTGYNQELDELHLIAADNKTWMQNFEQKIKEETGIKTMKVGFNKVFGYYIEVSKGQSSSVPPYFVRKQTLVNAERYIVPELKEFENKILGAKEKIEQLEYYLFDELRTLIRGKIKEIQETARAVSYIDVLTGLAEAAYKYNYVRPELNNNGEIKIVDGRHPVVERLLEKEIFVPNNTNLNNTDERMIIITGPNMAGKSTYMRQVALLVLMTQIGSFIPARQASVCPVDKIFTRVGASDDLATGQSTFMVEMNEVAQILKYATKNSLIILDEVGRGTSTFDGMAIARAVVEYTYSQKIGAKTLFATHYHELTDMEELFPGIVNYNIAAKKRGDSLIFLRKILRGGTDDSYGIEVAKLAGVPREVVKRAREILSEIESGARQSAPVKPQKEREPDLFTAIAATKSDDVAEKLRKTDLNTLTPIEAMNLLFELKKELE